MNCILGESSTTNNEVTLISLSTETKLIYRILSTSVSIYLTPSFTETFAAILISIQFDF